MRHSTLLSVTHNLAHSLGSGYSEATGVRFVDLFGCIRESRVGQLEVDLLTGKILRGETNIEVLQMLLCVPVALDQLCEKAGVSSQHLHSASATFTVGPFGPHFLLRIIDSNGRRSEVEYDGGTGRKVRIIESGARG